MVLSLRNNSARGTVGLDIDGGFVAALQLEHGRIERAASAPLEDGLVSDGEVTDTAALAAALKDFFKRHGLPRSVRLGVSNQQIVVRQIELPPIADEKELTAAVQFQAADAIAMPLEETVLDYRVASEAADESGSPRMQVVVVAARRSMVEQLATAVRGAGLKPEGIDLDAFALVRMLAGDDSSARVYCHLAGVTNLAIARGANCLFTRPLAARWDEADDQVAASALADEVRLSIDYYMAQPGAQPVAGLVLSGPGAQREALAERVGAALELEVTVAEPLGGLDASGLPSGEDPFRHTVSAGLAMGAAA